MRRNLQMHFDIHGLTQNGTARNQAIGGAGVSLGGEFSSLFINPAGLGFYKTSEIVITPGYSLKNFKSTYKNNPSPVPVTIIILILEPAAFYFHRLPRIKK